MDSVNQSPPAVVVGVDVGGTKILVGTVDRGGQIYREERYPMDRSSQSTVLTSLHNAVAAFMAGPGAAAYPLALGFGVVGYTDPAAGVWVQAINVPISHPVHLADEFGAAYGVPVALDNDVHAATLAELQLGVGRQATDFIYLNVGTGIAAGLVCNGQLVRGANNYAGELGHMVVEPDGDLCKCGRRGCLEPVASGGGILTQIRARLGSFPDSMLHQITESETLTTHHVFTAADAGDALATEVANRAVRGLSLALINLVNLLNPQLIVYGGGVFGDGWLIQRVTSEVMACALPVSRQTLQGIIPSPLHGDRVGLLGAASLAWLRHARLHAEQESST